MTSEEIKRFIMLYPNSDIARAYALGLKEKSIELSREIEKINFKKRN